MKLFFLYKKDRYCRNTFAYIGRIPVYKYSFKVNPKEIREKFEVYIEEIGALNTLNNKGEIIRQD